ncbi:MAG TPA: 50S ribosomal protein L9 [Gaiellaceae bacterium]|nr:50S ribosomal protein L9 [Gaiellaceae bacterium]
MEVILLSDVEHVGLRGEVVSVARGYARNFLLPRRLAEEATPARVAELRKRDARRAQQEAKTAEQAQAIADTLAKTVLSFEVKAGPTGSLFGSVTPTDIADEIWRTRKIRVDRRKIGVDAIKRIGRHQVPIDVFQDVRVEVKTLVVPEGGELPSDEELAAMEAAEQAEQQAAEAAHESHLEEILAEEDEAAAAEPAEPAEEPEPEPEWRADAEAALRDE